MYFSGAGAAAIATAEHYVRLGVRRDHVFLIDREGVVYEGRGKVDPYKARFALKTRARTLADALEGADALLLATEWNEFREPDFVKMKSLMRRPLIFDGRNIYNPKTVKALGFEYIGVGRR